MAGFLKIQGQVFAILQTFCKKRRRPIRKSNGAFSVMTEKG